MFCFVLGIFLKEIRCFIVHVWMSLKEKTRQLNIRYSNDAHTLFKTFLPGYLCKALSLANILLVLLHYMYVEYNSSVNII